jgi:hypothetical protein
MSNEAVLLAVIVILGNKIVLAFCVMLGFLGICVVK